MTSSPRISLRLLEKQQASPGAASKKRRRLLSNSSPPQISGPAADLRLNLTPSHSQSQDSVALDSQPAQPSPTPDSNLSCSIEMAERRADRSLEIYLHTLSQIPLLSICENWDLAYKFMLDEFDMAELLQYTVRTYDFLPQDARPGFRNAYHAILHAINEFPEILTCISENDLADELQDTDFQNDGITFLTYRLHQIRVCLQ